MAVPRQYESPLREEQARRTRLSIIEAALSQFLANGYHDTSIREIAGAAGVAERTVYTAFGDKASLLRAIADHAFFGGSQAGEGEGEFVDSLREIPDPLERLRTCMARTAAGYQHGLAALGRTMAGASMGDERLDRFLDEMVERRHEDIREFTSLILDRPLPRESEAMIDELEVLTSEAVYWILVVERGWSLEAYERHLVEMFVATLDRYGLAPSHHDEDS